MKVLGQIIPTLNEIMDNYLQQALVSHDAIMPCNMSKTEDGLLWVKWCVIFLSIFLFRSDHGFTLTNLNHKPFVYVCYVPVPTPSPSMWLKLKSFSMHKTQHQSY